jgi:CubicO group peptidase (beta-lactamase class C family)
MKGVLYFVCTTLFTLFLGTLPVSAVSLTATPQAVAPSPLVAPPQVDPPENRERVYRDPQGLFSVPVPAQWKTTERDRYLMLSSPEGRIIIHIMTLPGRDVEGAIAQAWEWVNPGFSLPATDVREVPSLNDLERIVSISYDTAEQRDKVALSLGQLYKDTVYVGLILGDLITLQQRAAQIRVIQSGFTIYEMTDPNLRGVEPLLVDEQIAAELTAYITAAMRRFNVPGVAVTIVQDGQLVYANGFGVRHLGHVEPVTPETLMLIGSTSKTMTTLMMSSLVDEGVIAWDTPVIDILPTFALAEPEATRRLTMRDLVCSCTGVPQRDFELFFLGHELTAKGVIDSLEDYPLFTNPGETFQYSNQMVAAGGYIAAVAASGKPTQFYEHYVAEMQRRVFDPIGMHATTFSLAEVAASADYARPHSVNLKLAPVALPLGVERAVTPVAPAGAVWSNALDLARYLVTELQQGVAPNGVRVVSAEGLSETWKPHVAVSAKASYGLGWFVDEYKGQPMLHHGGNTIGFTSDLALLPEANLGISVLTNVHGANFFTEAIRFRLLELVFQQAHQHDAYALYRYKMLSQQLAGPGGDVRKVDSAQVAAYQGYYANEVLGAIELRLWGDTLLLRAGPTVGDVRSQLNKAGELEQYIIFNPPMVGLPVRLETDESGDLIVILGMGVNEYRFERLRWNPGEGTAFSQPIMFLE